MKVAELLLENDLIAPSIYAVAVGRAIGLTVHDLQKAGVLVGAEVRLDGHVPLAISFKTELTGQGRNVKVADMFRKNCTASGVETRPLPWFYQRGSWGSGTEEKCYSLNFYFDRLKTSLPSGKIEAGLRSTAKELFDKIIVKNLSS